MTKKTLRAAAAAALVVASYGLAPALAGCARAAHTSTPPGAELRRDRDALTAEEIQASTHTDALGVVRTLRPAWLRSRGPESFRGGAGVVVYVDGRRAGGIGSLRELQAAAIRGMRYLDPAEATQRYGTDHAAGVIEVTSR